MVGAGPGARASTVGLACGALVSTFCVVAGALWYERLPMPDPLRFFFFCAALGTTASATAFAAAGWLGATILSGRRRIGIALGVALVGLVAWPAWAFFVLGRAFRPIEIAAIGGTALALAAGLALVAWVIARMPFSERRFGIPVIVGLAVAAFALHATRSDDYVPPAPLTESQTPKVDSPLASGPTNVLLLTIDTLRADHLSFYGYERDTSPNLRALAERSVVFENAVSQRTFTAPSLASILTGTYSETHKTHDNRSYLRPTNVTLAELLNAKGFRTAGVTGNVGLGPTFKFDQGFDSFEAVEVRGQEAVFRIDPWEAKLLNELAFPLLEDMHQDHFFIWMHYMDPHGPYIVTEEYRDLYANDPWSKRHGGSEVPAQSLQFLYGPILEAQPFFRKRELDFFISQYDAEIKYLDGKLGQLFELMTELDLWSNTLLIITADHGEAFGEHRGAYFEHYDPYHHTVHVPLLFSHPDLPAGIRIEQPVSLVDILPTVLALLGLPDNPLAQGQSLASLILKGDATGTRTHHFTTGVGRPDYCTQAVRTDTHKLIMDFRRHTFVFDALMEKLAALWVPPDFFNPYHYRSTVVELYDLEADPKERRNIALQEPDVVGELSESLWGWIESSRFEGRHHESVRAGIDPEINEALRALGYVE